MAKAKVKTSEEVVVEDVVVEDVVVEEVVVEEVEIKHPNPIIQMAIDQAKERFLRETAE